MLPDPTVCILWLHSLICPLESVWARPWRRGQEVRHPGEARGRQEPAVVVWAGCLSVEVLQVHPPGRTHWRDYSISAGLGMSQDPLGGADDEMSGCFLTL